MDQLSARAIGSGVHYPAIHLFSLYQRLGWKAGDFPVAERVGRNTLTLPLFPMMQDDDVDYVVENLVELVKAHRR
jgi:dTDP-4-amino-4,6-dideoxygalactose transaminase